MATSSDGARHHHHHHHHHFPHYGPTLASAHGVVGALLRLCETKVLQDKHKRCVVDGAAGAARRGSASAN